MDVLVLKDRGKFAVMEGKAFIDGQLATEATLMCMVTQ